MASARGLCSSTDTTVLEKHESTWQNTKNDKNCQKYRKYGVQGKSEQIGI